MARGDSGRVVLEIDPHLKRRLHARVAADGRSLKDWFVEQAAKYVGPEIDPQRSLPLEWIGTTGEGNG